MLTLRFLVSNAGMFLVLAKPWDVQDPLPKPFPSQLECLNWLKKRIQKLNCKAWGQRQAEEWRGHVLVPVCSSNGEGDGGEGTQQPPLFLSSVGCVCMYVCVRVHVCVCKNCSGFSTLYPVNDACYLLHNSKAWGSL